jgi:hypothetical protein
MSRISWWPLSGRMPNRLKPQSCLAGMTKPGEKLWKRLDPNISRNTRICLEPGIPIWLKREHDEPVSLGYPICCLFFSIMFGPGFQSQLIQNGSHPALSLCVTHVLLYCLLFLVFESPAFFLPKVVFNAHCAQ